MRALTTNFHPFFTLLFSFAIKSYTYKTDFTPGSSQNYHSEVLLLRSLLISSWVREVRFCPHDWAEYAINICAMNSPTMPILIPLLIRFDLQMPVAPPVFFVALFKTVVY